MLILRISGWNIGKLLGTEESRSSGADAPAHSETAVATFASHAGWNIGKLRDTEESTISSTNASVHGETAVALRLYLYMYALYAHIADIRMEYWKIAGRGTKHEQLRERTRTQRNRHTSVVWNQRMTIHLVRVDSRDLFEIKSCTCCVRSVDIASLSAGAFARPPLRSHVIRLSSGINR